MTDDGRSYSDDEMARILRKAAELQASGSPSVDLERSGLRLSEIKQIAAEVGIDGEFIDRASRLASVEPAMGKSDLWGPPRKTVHSYEVPGELSEAQLADLLDVVRDTMEEGGSVSEVLGTVQ